MERELLVQLLMVAAELDGAHARPPKASYTDLDILAVLFWAALNDRPISWAVRRENWPLCLWRRVLPSSATMSRRLRRPSIQVLLAALLMALHVHGEGERTLLLDGRPLTIANHSADPDADFGFAVGGKRNGYKLHEIADLLGNCRVYRVEPLRVSEQAAAREMLDELASGSADELLADANYDSNELYELAGRRHVQMLALRRNAKAKGVGHHRHSKHRLRALEIMHGRPGCINRRRLIEGVFGTQGNVIGGLGPLPNHVRRLRRVRLWVAAKLVIDALHRHRRHHRSAA